ncbi:MAG: ATP-dependent Clp protease proteolytic subunit [Candidatus Kapabacteria bacterium]|nr:ATP-dependent Clp protease proteolytic subunit [Ignavibacteriota bacterium]MCW5886391.1 ATP-dependent Clp protease proteolytic subunit [Candidatus Kapabacteria bacterium]
MIIDIFGVIGDAWSDNPITDESIRRQLKDKAEGEELIVYINSPGGSVTQGLAIYALLKEHKPEVRIIGEASSMATVLACAGSKVMMADSAVMLFHKPWSFTWGNEDEIEKTTKNLKTLKESMIKIYQNRTGKTAEEIEDILATDVYQNAEQCKEWGFVDEVYKPGEEDLVKASLSNKIMAHQKIRFYSLNNNYFNNNRKDDSMDLQAKYDALNAEHAKLQATSEAAVNDNTKLKAEVAKLTDEFKALSGDKVKIEQELESARKELQAAAAKDVETEVELFLAKIQDRILAKDRDELKAELLTLRKLEGNENAVVNGKSLYARKREELEARPSLSSITQPLPAAQGKQEGESERQTLARRVQELMASDKVDLNTAYNKVMEESN